MSKNGFTRSSWLLVACAAVLVGCPSPAPSNDAAVDVPIAEVVSDTVPIDAVDVAPPSDGPADVHDTGTDGPIAGDEDGDHHASMALGGDDCDDADANRYPGNTEVCDSSGHDEDCDAATFGMRDADGDRSIDSVCCNTDRGGTMHCGTDCNDTNPSVHPGQVEVCNGVDDDCNGVVDDGLPTLSYYVDADGDAFGDSSASPMSRCSPPSSGYVPNGTDCDDTNPSVHPGSVEVCNGIDDDCNGMSDENPTLLCPSGLTCASGMCR